VKTRPRSPFRRRRPASCRLESVDSVRFRRAMDEENAAEARRKHARDTRCYGLIRSAGLDPMSLDIDALIAISRVEGVVAFDDGALLVIVPVGAHDDHSEFDRAICRAGVREFVRRTMPSDRPGIGIPLDPSVPVPDVDLGDFVVVREMTEGVRTRFPISVEWGERVAEDPS
jgi:hypothetical protein